VQCSAVQCSVQCCAQTPQGEPTESPMEESPAGHGRTLATLPSLLVAAALHCTAHCAHCTAHTAHPSTVHRQHSTLKTLTPQKKSSPIKRTSSAWNQSVTEIQSAEVAVDEVAASPALAPCLGLLARSQFFVFHRKMPFGEFE
jgi:hypothetical protein